MRRRPLSVSPVWYVRGAQLTLCTDYDTDVVIRSSLRTQLGNDVTVITVAHRLQTIMDYDKIVSVRG
jgi:ABC-type multidrug transport system fused ATPase/permease subunit